MQTFQIKFSADLKGALALPASENLLKLIASSPIRTEKKKLATTDSGEDATNPTLISQELIKICSKIEVQLQQRHAEIAVLTNQFQELAVSMAMEIATAVVRYEINEHETRIRQLLDDLIARHESPVPMVAYVNNLDLEPLRISLLDTQSLGSMLQLKTDDRLARGEIRVESSEGRMIASWQHQLADIQSRLLEYLSNARLESSSH